MNLYEGQQLGNYRLIRKIGSGGFAEVYLGEHVHLKNQAAIKVLLQMHLGADEQQNFITEARTIVRLDHPNIVKLVDFGFEATTPYLVLQYAENGTLRQQHPKGAQVPLSIILPYIKQIAAALQYAHGFGLIHRDIKPENMLVGQRGAILLTDFGIAVISESASYRQTLDVAGTLGYMAPEQFQGKPGPASDQYSLAAVVYEWLSGSRPFNGTMQEILAQQQQGLVPPLHTKVPAMSPAIENVVSQGLAYEPRQRFPNVQDFALALEQANQAGGFQSTQRPVFLKPEQTWNVAPAGFTQTIAASASQVSFVPLTGPPKRPNVLRRLFSLDIRALNMRKVRKHRAFLLFGTIGDFICALIVGGLGQHSWDIWLWSLLLAVFVRFWCAAAVTRNLATPLAVALALYWGASAWVLGDALHALLHIGCIPPGYIIGVFTFLPTLFFHLKYTNRKY